MDATHGRMLVTVDDRPCSRAADDGLSLEFEPLPNLRKGHRCLKVAARFLVRIYEMIWEEGGTSTLHLQMIGAVARSPSQALNP